MEIPNINIPTELFVNFNKLKYYDKPHKYFVDNKELVSVTTLIHKYQEDFDSEYWSKYKANEFNLKQKDILRAWSFINKKGTIKGSIIHDYAENLFLNKIFEYPKKTILNEFGFDPILKEYEITKKHVDKFYDDSYNKLIPIKTELVVYDIESMIGGMVDMLFYNVKAKEFQLYDWKTNKEFTYNNPKKHLLDELSILENCDLNLYSLQLELYKQIIKKHININLGKSYVVWFSHRNNNYEIIETKDYSFFIKKIMEKRTNEINN